MAAKGQIALHVRNSIDICGETHNATNGFISFHARGWKRGDDLEEPFGAGHAEGNEARLVDDRRLLTRGLFSQALQAPFVGGLDELMHESSGGREAD